MRTEGLEPNASDPGTTEGEIGQLVEAVNRHARALVLLAREVARQGVRTTTETLQGLMADLHKRYPDDRENSLYASLELSLRRLPDPVREKIVGLGMFHGGGRLENLAHVMGVEVESARRIAAQLIEVGLAEDLGRLYLRLDPALPSYLLSKMDDEERSQMQTRWAEAMTQLVGFLSQQRSQDTQLAAELTLLELPNLLVWLKWVAETQPPEEVVDRADSVERLLSNLGRPQALAEATRIREAAAQKLGTDSTWSHAQHLAEAGAIERLLERGDLQAALDTAQRLLQRCLAAGDDAYQGAAYDAGMAHNLLGQALQAGGAAEAALGPYGEAHDRFQRLADTGNAAAERMASVVRARRAGCLLFLGRLDEAAAAYEESITLDEKRDAQRDVAVNKLNLGTVRLEQRRHAEALAIYIKARETFEALGEPGEVATAWHQIGCTKRPESGITPRGRIVVPWQSRCNRAIAPAKRAAWGNSATSMMRWGVRKNR
jgi:tetratricopeptide (TPR) repeat protein